MDLRGERLCFAVLLSPAPFSLPLFSPQLLRSVLSPLHCPAMSDDEPVDPKIELHKKFEPQCSKHWKEYEECGKRLEKLGPDSGKNCGGWYNEYWKCMDEQISKELFSRLK